MFSPVSRISSCLFCFSEASPWHVDEDSGPGGWMSKALAGNKKCAYGEADWIRWQEQQPSATGLLHS
jgi:hypothetical protein